MTLLDFDYIVYRSIQRGIADPCGVTRSQDQRGGALRTCAPVAKGGVISASTDRSTRTALSVTNALGFSRGGS